VKQYEKAHKKKYQSMILEELPGQEKTILVRDHNEITLADIEELYDLQRGHEPQPWEYDLLKRTREQSLILFEVNSSYGGTCCVLAKTVELLECRDWKKRFLDFD
jgi:hypothetical protein